MAIVYITAVFVTNSKTAMVGFDPQISCTSQTSNSQHCDQRPPLQPFTLSISFNINDYRL